MIAFFLFEFYWLLFSWFCFIRNINYKQRMKRDKERKTNDVRLWMQNGCVVLAEWYDSKSIRHSGKIYWTVILARVFNLAVSPNGNLLNLSIRFPWFALESNKVTNRFFKPCSRENEKFVFVSVRQHSGFVYTACNLQSMRPSQSAISPT